MVISSEFRMGIETITIAKTHPTLKSVTYLMLHLNTIFHLEELVFSIPSRYLKISNFVF